MVGQIREGKLVIVFGNQSMATDHLARDAFGQLLDGKN